MTRYAYKLHSVPKWIEPVHLTDDPTTTLQNENPEIQRLRDGTWEPPPGWRVKGMQEFTYSLCFLLEREAQEHPYR